MKEKEAKNNELERLKPLVFRIFEAVRPMINEKWKSKQCFEIFLAAVNDPNNQVCLVDGVTPANYSDFIEVKDKLDEILIKEIRKELLDEIECCFAGYGSPMIFRYPKVFYVLNGHYLEEVVYSMFFKSPLYRNGLLVNEIVRENGMINECGCIVPNELYEILQRIDSFEITNLIFNNSNSSI